METKPMDVDDLLQDDLPSDDQFLLEESIYDEVENYYDGDILDMVQ